MTLSPVSYLSPWKRSRHFIALLKPRVMSLVLFTAFTGMVLAPGQHPYLQSIWSLSLIALGAGAAGAINMWYDRDIDIHMLRTAARPIPAGYISAQEALIFGSSLAIGSIILMAWTVNLTAAYLLALTIGFYIFIYTMWLKRTTPQNIVIGGAAGAFPPMIGWAAVTNSLALEPVLLFAIIFLWTPPHFWALCLYHSQDYAKVGVPMMPVVAGIASTKKQIVAYSLSLPLVAFAPYFLGYQGALYLSIAIVLNVMFIQGAFKVLLTDDEKYAKRLFGFSILYLFLLFAAMILDHYWPL